MGLVDKVVDRRRLPVIATCESVVVVHPLLNNSPIAVSIEQEDVMVELVSILDSSTVYLG
jgi:hypothetical protein